MFFHHLPLETSFQGILQLAFLEDDSYLGELLKIEGIFLQGIQQLIIALLESGFEFQELLQKRLSVIDAIPVTRDVILAMKVLDPVDGSDEGVDVGGNIRVPGA